MKEQSSTLDLSMLDQLADLKATPTITFHPDGTITGHVSIKNWTLPAAFSAKDIKKLLSKMYEYTVDYKSDLSALKKD